MKIYETRTAPNPRLVRIFLAEKGMSAEYIELDIAAGENLSAAMRAKNVTTKVPFLELDDGTVIGETAAICRYIEEIQSAPALMGNSPVEKAIIEMWRRRVEFGFFMPVGMCFQHSTGYFKDRMTPVAEFGAVSGKIALDFLNVINDQLATNEYVAGASFSIADITLLVAIDFARVMKIRIGDQHPHVQRWYEMVSSRKSAQA